MKGRREEGSNGRVPQNIDDGFPNFIGIRCGGMDFAMEDTEEMITFSRDQGEDLVPLGFLCR